MKNCIISVGIRRPYNRYILRLEDTIERYGVDYFLWVDQLPPNARTHHQSLYGFKVYAFLNAFSFGFDNVLWLDSPCYLRSDPAPIFKQIHNDGYYLIHSVDELWKYVNERTRRAFNIERKDIREKDWRLLSGSFIGINKENIGLLEEWKSYEQQDFFYSAKEDASQIKEYEGDSGHRHDEAVLSMLAWSKGLKIEKVWDSHFQNDSPKCIVKADKW